MSWLRSAVNKAVVVGGNTKLTRTVRDYADSVVQQAGQAVVGGAKLLHDRLAARNLQSFKHAVRILEEVSVSYRGVERVQLLRRWLVALREIERLSAAVDEPLSTEKATAPFSTSDESKDPLRKPNMVMYYDTDHGGEPMNFRDVFLLSEALEGMTLSMILEAPMEEEVTLLQEIFGLCLMGGKEVHDAMVRYIQDLAKVFSNYEDEVLAKREELLQYAQGAIAGLKINAYIVRIDSEISHIHQNLDDPSALLSSSESAEMGHGPKMIATEEALEEALAQVQLYSKLQGLLLRKKCLHNGDSPNIHAQKVDKLKVLSESLASSVYKAEKRISEQRFQREEALKYRVTRTSEVSQLEKDLAAEVEALEKQLNELELKLKKVKTSLATARARLHNAREELEQFGEASNQILQHFKTKDDELSRSVASYRTEAAVCNAFIKFMEESWLFQSSYNVQKAKLVNDEWKKYEDHFMSLALHLLSTYKGELQKSISIIRKVNESLRRSEIAAGLKEYKSDATNPRKRLEEEYLNAECKFMTMFSVVESIKKQFDTQDTEISRKNDHRVEDLFDALDKLKSDFESIERPTLEAETPMKQKETSNSPFLSPDVAPNEKPVLEDEPKADTLRAQALRKSISTNLRLNSAFLEPKQGKCVSPSVKGNKALEAQLSRLKLEMELEERGEGYSADEIGDWECDAVHK